MAIKSVRDRNLKSAGHHAADSLTGVIEAHPFRHF